jgi:hypothetical protein
VYLLATFLVPYISYYLDNDDDVADVVGGRLSYCYNMVFVDHVANDHPRTQLHFYCCHRRANVFLDRA